MFEQSLYETEPVIITEPVATPLESGDLFHTYEIKNWEFTPRMYKIFAAASVFNLLALVFFAQTSLLTAKGCDTPFVGRVCEVLDTVYVGSMLFGTQREYVDAAYDKTDLGDADITYVDVSGETPPLSYPDGYFQIANPNEYQAMLDQANNPAPPIDMSGFPTDLTTTPSTGNNLIDTKPVIPKTNPNVIDGELPTIDDRTGLADPPISRPKGPGMGRIRTPGATAITPKPTPDPKAQVADKKVDPPAKVDPTDPQAAIDINKRPFVDLANNVNDLLDKKQVKLESPFIVNAAGKLTKEGKLDPKSFRWGQVTGQDQKMIDVIKEAVAAINDSGYLQYLKDISGKDFNLMLQQDDVNITAVVQSEMESDMRARSISSALGLLISAAKSRKSGENADQNDKDDLILLNNAKIEADGKKIVIRFLVPKDIALPMIQRKLAEQAKEPRQPNSNAVTKPTNNVGN